MATKTTRDDKILLGLDGLLRLFDGLLRNAKASFLFSNTWGSYANSLESLVFRKPK